MPRAALLFLLAPLAGCVSYWKGQELQTDIVALQGTTEQLSEGNKKSREELKAELATLAERVNAIEKSLVQAIDQVRSGTANSGLELENVKQQLDALKGQLAVLENKASQSAPLATPGAVTEPSAPASAPLLPDNPADLYRYGYERKNANDCAEAVRAFSIFVQKFGGNDRADNALYLASECQFSAKDHTGSIRTLQTILQKYSKGDKIDDALLLMHDNFVAMGRCKDAAPFLETLIADHPKSSLLDTAQKKLAKTKKGCR